MSLAARVESERARLRRMHHETGLIILNGADEGMNTAPLWMVTDPRDGQRYLIHELYAWAAEEEADELLGLV